MANLMAVAFGTVTAAGVALAAFGPPGSRAPEAASASSSPATARPAAANISPAAAPTTTAPATSPTPVAVTTVSDPARTSWVIPDADKLPDDAWGRTVRYGRDLVAKTFALIGPEVGDTAHRFAGNNLACASCHLEAGTKQYGLPFQGVYADFPNYRARSGAVGTIEDRIQGCMTRSMNGKPLPPAGPEMTALVAYMKFLSDGRPVGAPTPGRGAGRMTELTRAADAARGKEIYEQNCAACHGANGLGQRVGEVGDAQGYTFPPLWGDDSFNDGAGMDRLIRAANFIHSNMPNGTTWQAPALSEQDAWDVGAYMQSQPRPQKANLDRDYPVALQRPADSGYGPYADGFSPEQHRLGPFAPIRAHQGAAVTILVESGDAVMPGAGAEAYWPSLGGGILIGLASAVLLLLNGRVAGISGIAGNMLRQPDRDTPWRAAFLTGLMAGPLLFTVLAGHRPPVHILASWPVLVFAGLLVGFGTRLGSGCTSGHGVSGLARLSRRSIAATAMFMTFAIVTVFLVRHVFLDGVS